MIPAQPSDIDETRPPEVDEMLVAVLEAQVRDAAFTTNALIDNLTAQLRETEKYFAAFYDAIDRQPEHSMSVTTYRSLQRWAWLREQIDREAAVSS